MIIHITLVCYEHRYVSLLATFNLSQPDTALCDSAFTGSKYALCIQPSVLELSVNANMYDPCPICSMVM